MPTTPRLVLRYPVLADAANVPLFIQNLAEDVDAAVGNTWTAYNPVWSQTDGTVLNIGNGTLTGAYRKIGRLVVARITLVRGSTTNLGTSSYAWSLPFAAADFYQGGTGLVQRGVEIPCIARLSTSTTVVLLRSTDAARIGPTNPGAWAAGDYIHLNLTYESAA